MVYVHINPLSTPTPDLHLLRTSHKDDLQGLAGCFKTTQLYGQVISQICETHLPPANTSAQPAERSTGKRCVCLCTYKLYTNTKILYTIYIYTYIHYIHIYIYTYIYIYTIQRDVAAAKIGKEESDLERTALRARIRTLESELESVKVRGVFVCALYTNTYILIY
jgi:cell division protein FtsL